MLALHPIIIIPRPVTPVITFPRPELFEDLDLDVGGFAALLGTAFEKLFKGGIFPGVSKFDACVKALTEDTVTVTGDDIPLEEATLFGGLVEETTYTPDELLAAMDELFTKTNKALSEIVNAFSGAEQNRKDIEALLAGIEEIVPRLEAAELTFAPYETKLAGIKKRQGQFLAILASNPLKAFANSEVVEADTEILKADLAMEMEAIPLLKEAAEYCQQVRDFTSGQIFEDILASEEEHVDFLETQFDMIERMGLPVRDVLRQKGTPYDELGLGEDKWSDDELIDFMMEHPILINRPIVVSEKGVRLCRPSETVLDLLPRDIGDFVKEDGEVVKKGA